MPENAEKATRATGLAPSKLQSFGARYFREYPSFQILHIYDISVVVCGDLQWLAGRQGKPPQIATEILRRIWDDRYSQKHRVPQIRLVYFKGAVHRSTIVYNLVAL